MLFRRKILVGNSSIAVYRYLRNLSLTITRDDKIACRLFYMNGITLTAALNLSNPLSHLPATRESH
jgi:hypothetical protein